MTHPFFKTTKFKHADLEAFCSEQRDPETGLRVYKSNDERFGRWIADRADRLAGAGLAVVNWHWRAMQVVRKNARLSDVEWPMDHVFSLATPTGVPIAVIANPYSAGRQDAANFGPVNRRYQVGLGGETLRLYVGDLGAGDCVAALVIWPVGETFLAHVERVLGHCIEDHELRQEFEAVRDELPGRSASALPSATPGEDERLHLFEELRPIVGSERALASLSIRGASASPLTNPADPQSTARAREWLIEIRSIRADIARGALTAADGHKVVQRQLRHVKCWPVSERDGLLSLWNRLLLGCDLQEAERAARELFEQRVARAG